MRLLSARFMLPLFCAALVCAGCVLKVFGLGPTLDEAVKGLSTAIGVELVMEKADEKVFKFNRYVSRGGPPTLEAIGPAEGPAAYTLVAALDQTGKAQLAAMLDVLIPDWNDRAAWLSSALRKLEGSAKPKGRIRMEPFTNRVVVLMVDRKSAKASLSVMTLVWEDYISSFKQRASAGDGS